MLKKILCVIISLNFSPIFAKIILIDPGHGGMENGAIGKKVLNNYLNYLNGGGSNCTKYHDDPIKCQSSKDKTGNYCVYSAAKYRGDGLPM